MNSISVVSISRPFVYRARVCPAPPISSPLLEMLLLARDPPLSYTDIYEACDRLSTRLSVNSYHALTLDR